MTDTDLLDMLRERRGLERIAASIGRLVVAAPEWKYALVAINDRLKWSTYGLSVADPQQLAHAEAILNAESEPMFTSKDWASAWH